MLFQTKIRTLFQLKELLEQEDDPAFIERIKLNPRQALTDIIEEPQEEEYEEYDIRSFDELRKRMQKDPRLIDILKHDPQGFLQRMAKDQLQPEFKIYRLLVGSLCLLVIMITLGMILAWTVLKSRTAPDSITAMGCMALGLLAGTFISVPGRSMRANNDRNQNFHPRNKNTR